VKKENFQTHRIRFESLKRKDEENVATYFLHVHEILNTIRGFGEKVEEPMIEKKVLSSPPLIFDVKVSTIEEMNDMETNDG
jgi:hypothetical protein